jgi:hypothetical protein
MRKLASIKTVSQLLPIEGKDRIELAIIDAWQVIVKKGEFTIGDSCVFCEIDSVLPDKEEFEFLRSKKFRIKTMKMGGVLSQGICFPMSFLPVGKYEVEQDVTEIMGVTKYEPNEENVVDTESTGLKGRQFQHPIYKFLFRWKFFRTLLMPKKMNKGFPAFISMTDETRVQNIPFVFNNKDIEYVVREKIDGCSMTVFLRRLKKKFPWQKEAFDFGVCSRTVRLWTSSDGSPHYWRAVEKYNLKEVLEDLIGDKEFVAIQGEIRDPKVQGNKYKVTETDFHAFNLIYPDGKVACLLAEPILEEYGIPWCPLIEARYTLPETVNELLDYSTAQSVVGDTLREGIVLRNYGKNTSFKAVSPDFLIKYNE